MVRNSRLQSRDVIQTHHQFSTDFATQGIIDPVRLVLAARIACTISGWPAAAGGARASGAPGYEVGRWGVWSAQLFASERIRGES
jgi:hypothetical protein